MPEHYKFSHHFTSSQFHASSASPASQEEHFREIGNEFIFQKIPLLPRSISRARFLIINLCFSHKLNTNMQTF